jgi:hypothetical protein
MANNNEISGSKDSEIIFDAKCGISQEEQQQILADINGIAEKNRRSLSFSGAKEKIKAKKNNGLFPLAVNCIALVFLAGGFFLLSSVHGREDFILREGSRVYNAAERALINEIRSETLLRITEKENEINQITAKMEEVDVILSELHSANFDLTAEQRLAQENLLLLQADYRQSLSLLLDEHSGILENARAKELALNAQLDERTRQFNIATYEKDSALESARTELERLSKDQDKINVIEAQLTAFITSANEKIRSSQLNDASMLIDNMKQFLDTPVFQGIRSFNIRRDFYDRSIVLLETLIREIRVNQGEKIPAAIIQSIESDKTPDKPDNKIAEKAMKELQVKNSQLEETIVGLNQTIKDISSQGSDTVQRLTELGNANNTLRSLNLALEASADLRDQAIKELESEKAALESELATLRQALRMLSQ